MGQNCFGVGTPILSPEPPAGSTAATASESLPDSARAALLEEAEVARGAPLRRRPGSAGLEPPGGPGSMAAKLPAAEEEVFRADANRGGRS
jgi:hypothetical protein